MLIRFIIVEYLETITLRENDFLIHTLTFDIILTS